MKYVWVTKSGKKRRITEKLVIKYTKPSKSDNTKRTKYKLKVMKRLIKTKSITVNSKAQLGTRLGVDISKFMEIKERTETPAEVEETEMKITEEEKTKMGIVVDGLVSCYLEDSPNFGFMKQNDFYCEFKFTAKFVDANNYDINEVKDKAERMMKAGLRKHFRYGLGEGVSIDETASRSGIEQEHFENVEADDFRGWLYYGHQSGYKDMIKFKEEEIDDGILNEYGD